MAEMSIDKKSIRNFLSSGKTFLIPYYQRQYNWREEQCQTLWEDIENFFEIAMKDQNDEYFLGCIVGFIDEEDNKCFEVIDGQQRITTLSLLFRALYEKASSAEFQNDKTKGFVKSFGKCLWHFDEGSDRLIITNLFCKARLY